MKTQGIIRRSIVVLFLGVASWFYAKTYFRPNWGWPLALAFGAVYILVISYIVRRAVGKPAPFQLVLRMANDKGGDEDDNRTFKKLRERFKSVLSGPGVVRFDGFDTDGRWIWFYFHGPDDQTVREAVLSQLQDCQVHDGSYFLSGATQTCAPPNNGLALRLGGLHQ
jgi:hypothetical protein